MPLRSAATPSGGRTNAQTPLTSQGYSGRSAISIGPAALNNSGPASLQAAVQFVRRHSLVVVLTLILVAHLVSVAYVSGTRHLSVGTTYLALVLVAYALIFLVTGRFAPLYAKLGSLTGRVAFHPVTATISIGVIIFPVVFLVLARRVPMLEMWFSSDYYVASNIRHDFYDNLAGHQKYILDYYLRGLAPFWILYTYLNRSKYFAPVLIASTFLAFVIVTKISILILLLPLTAYLAFRGRWIKMAIAIAGILALMGANVIIQSKDTLVIQSADTTTENPNQVEAGEVVDYAKVAAYSAAEGIMSRALYVHGLVETQWLDLYPDAKPFENGCGYRWLASFIGCDFVNMPREVWLHYYPDLKARGLLGSVTASDYVTAYSNFGMVGVGICALLMALLLNLVGSIYQSAALALCLNLAPLALSLESPISTLLNSGGWGLTILLSLLFLGSSDPAPTPKVKELI